MRSPDGFALGAAAEHRFARPPQCARPVLTGPRRDDASSRQRPDRGSGQIEARPTPSTVSRDTSTIARAYASSASNAIQIPSASYRRAHPGAAPNSPSSTRLDLLARARGGAWERYDPSRYEALAGTYRHPRGIDPSYSTTVAPRAELPRSSHNPGAARCSESQELEPVHQCRPRPTTFGTVTLSPLRPSGSARVMGRPGPIESGDARAPGCSGAI